MSPIKSSKRENEKEEELQYLIDSDFLHSLGNLVCSLVEVGGSVMFQIREFSAQNEAN